MTPEAKAQYIKRFQLTPQVPLEASFDDTKIRCIFDTNVLMDFWVFNNPTGLAILENLDRLTLIGHEETFCEFADVIARSHFALSDDQQAALLKQWSKVHCIWPENLSKDLYCRDADDNKFFNLGHATRAQYLVSRDKKVLKARGKAGRFGLTVLTPEAFLEILGAI